MQIIKTPNFGGARIRMKKELFEELIECVKQGWKILRGEMEPGRVFDFDEVDMAEKRELIGLMQDKFKNKKKTSNG